MRPPEGRHLPSHDAAAFADLDADAARIFFHVTHRLGHSNTNFFLASIPKSPEGPQESVGIMELADLMLYVYDEIDLRAHEKYLVRGAEPDQALDDWLAVERELSPPTSLEISESENFVQAVARLPEVSAGQIAVGIEESVALFVVREDPSSSRVQRFGIFRLPTLVHPERSIAVFAGGVLAIRTSKAPAPSR